MVSLPSTRLLRRTAAVTAATFIAATLSAPALATDDQGRVTEHTSGDLAIAGSASGTDESLIVELKPGASIHGAEVLDADANVVKISVDAEDAAGVASELAHSNAVAAVEPDIRLRWMFNAESLNDPMVGAQWELDAIRWFGNAPPQNAPLIALLDSGIDRNHPEFAGNMPDGRPKLKATWNAMTGSTNVTDTLGHGTATASVAAALANNGHGIAGVSPYSQIMMVKVGGVSGLSMSDAIRGLNWAVDRGARVVNMSFGTTRPSAALRNATLRAASRGVVLIAAAGNEGCPGEGGGNDLNYPAGYPHVIAVSASDASNRIACFSNHGPEVDIAAPGHRVRLAVTRGDAWGTMQSQSGYMVGSGTSFASPAVAGAAATILAKHPRWTPDQVGAVLTGTARDVVRRGWDERSGWGILNIQRAAAQRRHGLSDTDEVDDDIFLTRRIRPLVQRGRRGRRVRANIDRSADPSDVHRVFVRRGQRLLVAARFARTGKYTLRIWHPRARSVEAGGRLRRKTLVAESRPGRRGARVSTRAGRSGYWYVQVVADNGRGAYKLKANIRRR